MAKTKITDTQEENVLSTEDMSDAIHLQLPKLRLNDVSNEVISLKLLLVGFGYAISKFVRQHLKKNKFPEEERLRLYELALLKQQAIIDALKEDSKVSKERADYLQSLNEILQEAIKELKSNTARQ